MQPISDEYMRDMLTKTKVYTAVLLRGTDKANEPEAGPVMWEHGRRNFALRAEGLLSIVCPVSDESVWAGIGIFDAEPEEVARLMEGDPGVQAGIFTYEAHPVHGFPGDRLPG